MSDLFDNFKKFNCDYCDSFVTVNMDFEPKINSVQCKCGRLIRIRE